MERLAKLEVGEILAATMDRFSAQAVTFLSTIAVAGILGAAVDIWVTQASNIVVNLLNFLVGVFATHAGLTGNFGKESGIKPRFARAFGVSCISGMGIICGLALLIVPGVLLIVRWAIALPAMMAEDLSLLESLGRSRDLTQGNRWPIFGLQLLMWIPTALLIGLFVGLSVGFGAAGSETNLWSDLVLNLCTSTISVVSALVWVEVYLSLSGARDHESALEEIFA